jgi:hypothetical protein
MAACSQNKNSLRYCSSAALWQEISAMFLIADEQTAIAHISNGWHNYAGLSEELKQNLAVFNSAKDISKRAILHLPKQFLEDDSYVSGDDIARLSISEDSLVVLSYLPLSKLLKHDASVRKLLEKQGRKAWLYLLDDYKSEPLVLDYLWQCYENNKLSDVKIDQAEEKSVACEVLQRLDSSLKNDNLQKLDLASLRKMMGKYLDSSMLLDLNTCPSSFLS